MSKTPSTNFYDILGIKKEASPTEIKSAYRKLMLLAHPDKGGNPGLFSMIQEAYDTLSDKDKKEVYDYTLHNPMQNSASTAKNPSTSTTPKADTVPSYGFRLDDFYARPPATSSTPAFEQTYYTEPKRILQSNGKLQMVKNLFRKLSTKHTVDFKLLCLCFLLGAIFAVMAAYSPTISIYSKEVTHPLSFYLLLAWGMVFAGTSHYIIIWHKTVKQQYKYGVYIAPVFCAALLAFLLKSLMYSSIVLMFALIFVISLKLVGWKKAKK